MKVTVLVPGVYLNEALKAKSCQARETLETREWYGDQMVVAGQAERAVEPEGPAGIELPARKSKKKAAPRKASATRPNPFLS